MIPSNCQSLPLEALLSDQCKPDTQLELEKHLEHCEHCQRRLAELAASEELWTQAASCLSTIEDLRLPANVSQRLQSSNSFVVPTIEADAHPEQFQTAHNSWTKILDPPSHPETLGRIDQFEIESKLGQGGMGIVLKGFDRELNRAVAIKILAPYLAANGTARRRFAREAQAAAAVVHPNVVRIYSVNKSPDRPYLVMELGPSHSLQSLVQEQGPLHPTDIVRISMQVASGLAAAHKIGLIHRDVKPGNILMEQDVSRVMITDFGLARAADDAGMTQTGWLAGTPHYMSPEQGIGEDLDHRSDLFSLGSLMYFLATGREPFRAEKPYAVIQKIVNDRPRHPIDANSEVPQMLADIIDKLLEKDPKNRFQSANELSDVLEQYLAHLQQPQTAKPPKRILTHRRKQRVLWIKRIIAACLAGCFLTAAWMFGDSLFGPTNKKGTGSPQVTTPSTDQPFSPLATKEIKTAPPVIVSPELKQSSDIETAAAAPQSEPSINALTAAGFDFDDNSFTAAISQLDHDLERLETSLRTMTPISTALPTTQSVEPSLERQLNSASETLEQNQQAIETMIDMNRRQFESSPTPFSNEKFIEDGATTNSENESKNQERDNNED